MLMLKVVAVVVLRYMSHWCRKCGCDAAIAAVGVVVSFGSCGLIGTDADGGGGGGSGV